MSTKSLRALVLAYAALAYQAHGAAITVPPGLNPGDTYRILFVTSTARDATSSNIADYNTFVTNAANLDPNMVLLGTTWKALASTLAVNALENAGLSTSDTTTRFFNTNGQLIATGTTVPLSGLYGGPPTYHRALITDEAGGSNTSLIWTGTDSQGASALPYVLGNGQAALITAGDIRPTDDWTNTVRAQMAEQLRIYGVSGVLTVPDPGVPEPGTIALTGLGAAAMLLLPRFRKPRNNPAKTQD